MSKQKKLTFNWGTGLAVVIVFFVVATLSVVGFIISLDFDLVSKDHYEKGVQYEEQIQKIEHARALDEPVQIQFMTEEDAVEIIFPKQIASQQLSGTVTLYRPSDSSLDRTYRLQLNDDSIQKIDTRELAHGKWLVKLEWQKAGQSYFEQASIFM